MTEILKDLEEFKPLEALRSEIQKISEVALAQQITSKETKDAALQIGSDVKRVRKALDTRRKQITAPMQDAVKRVIALADTLDAPLEQAEAHIRRQAIKYADRIAEEQRLKDAALEAEKMRLRQEEEVKMRNAAALANDFQDQMHLQKQAQEEIKEKAVDLKSREVELKNNAVKGTTQVWKFEVTDEKLLPREFLKVDESAIRSAVTVRKIREIPGVRIYAETQVRLS